MWVVAQAAKQPLLQLSSFSRFLDVIFSAVSCCTGNEVSFPITIKTLFPFIPCPQLIAAFTFVFSSFLFSFKYQSYLIIFILSVMSISSIYWSYCINLPPWFHPNLQEANISVIKLVDIRQTLSNKLQRKPNVSKRCHCRQCMYFINNPQEALDCRDVEQKDTMHVCSHTGNLEHFVEIASQTEFAGSLSSPMCHCLGGSVTSAPQFTQWMGKTLAPESREAQAKKQMWGDNNHYIVKHWGWDVLRNLGAGDRHSILCLWSSDSWFLWRCESLKTFIFLLIVLAHAVLRVCDSLHSLGFILLAWQTLSSSSKSWFSGHFLLDTFPFSLGEN